MKTKALALPPTSSLAKSPASARLVQAFLAGRGERTMAAYGQDLESFRAFLGARTLDEAADVLLGGGHGEANAIALAYRAHLVARGLAAATINRRLAALRSLLKLARTLGRVPWVLEVENVPSQPYRDTRGPGREGFLRLVAQLEGTPGKKAARNRAVLRLLFDLALRRGEVVSLDFEHLDVGAGTLAVLGKGRSARVPLTLPGPTKAALLAWLAQRGDTPGPLFPNLDRRSKGKRLTGRGLALIVGALGDAVGLRVRPHGLRHAAITEALELTRGDVRAVQKFSRHRDLRTLTVYDDSRRDIGGDVARMVAGGHQAAGEAGGDR